MRYGSAFYPDAQARRHRPLLYSALFHGALFGLLILPAKTARLMTVPHGTIERVHYTTLSYATLEPGRARSPHRSPPVRRSRREGRMERVPRLPAPPRVGTLDLHVALNLVSTTEAGVPDVVKPALVDTLIGNGLADSPFISRSRAATEGGSGDAGNDSVAFIAADVDRTVSADGGNPKPIYPRDMLARMVETTFSIYFVVDTAGRIDPNSVQVPPSVHPSFAKAVRDVLPRWRFVPAEVRGRRVRQLMEQNFRFRIVNGQLVLADSPALGEPT